MSIAVYRSARAAAAAPVSLAKGMESTEIFGSKEGEQPMSCGLFTATQGHTTGFKYPCAEFTIVLEGELQLEDTAKPGEVITAKKGDVLRVDKGASVKWSSPSSGTGFWVSQIPSGTDLTQYIV